MCTALNLSKNKFYLFGRNMDIEKSFGQKVTIVPRNFSWPFRFFPKPIKQTYAIIGMAAIYQDLENKSQDYPLFAEAANEKGLACAGLNFPDNAFYMDPKEKNSSKIPQVVITPYEVIPWILSQFVSVDEVKKFLKNNNLVIANKKISPFIPLAPLHFIISDKKSSIVIEPMKEGLKIYDNPLGILTNNPPFEWQMTNLSFYQNLVTEASSDVKWCGYEIKPFGQGFGSFGLPGDCTPPSRFVRTAFYKNNSSSGKLEEELITQFFHILDSVAMVKGSIIVRNKKNKEIFHDDITLYTSCIDLNKGIYYYKTYWNNQINAIDMFSFGESFLNGKKLKTFIFSEKQAINFL